MKSLLVRKLRKEVIIMKYTKAQREAYSQLLREKWKYAKALADRDETAKALYVEMGKDVSYYSFYFTLMDMKKNGYDGLPYIDCKTFDGWRKIGMRVKKGEKSKISGIVWLEFKTKRIVKDDEDKEKNKFIYPKLYHLFHRTQTEEVSKL